MLTLRSHAFPVFEFENNLIFKTFLHLQLHKITLTCNVRLSCWTTHFSPYYICRNTTNHKQHHRDTSINIFYELYCIRFQYYSNLLRFSFVFINFFEQKLPKPKETPEKCLTLQLRLVFVYVDLHICGSSRKVQVQVRKNGNQGKEDWQHFKL